MAERGLLTPEKRIIERGTVEGEEVIHEGLSHSEELKTENKLPEKETEEGVANPFTWFTD